MNPWVKTCEACGERMLMAIHERTRSRAPFDPFLVAGGNIEIKRCTEGGRMLLTYRIITKAEAELDPTRLRHQSHFASCSHPERFRQRG